MLSFNEDLNNPNVRLIGTVKGGNLNGDLIFIQRKNNKTSNQIEEICIPDGELIPLPYITQSYMYAAGPQGSGKSYRSAKWICAYKLLKPSNKVYLIKRNDSEDPVYVGIDLIEIKHKDVYKYKLENLENSLVVFDDVTRIPNKQLYNYIHETT